MHEIITDSKTNSVCFSSLLSKFKLWKDLERILNEKEINYSFIYDTKDIWVRDFMPIQIHEDNYIQFLYEPSYLQNLPEYRTDYHCCTVFGSQYHTHYCSDLRVDGGNVIKCDDCVIMTDKVFIENPEKTPAEVIKTLEDVFKCELVIIPHDPEEMTGHADGMVRFVGDNTILLNHYYDFDKPLRKKLLDVLSHRFNVIELHLDTDRYLATSWSYINFLQVGKHLIAPAVNKKLDEKAFKQLEEVFHLAVDFVPALGIVRLGGGLNCASWTKWDGLLWAYEQINNHHDTHSEY